MLRQLIISAHALFLNFAKKIDAGGDEKLIINFMWPKCGWYVSITARSKHKLALGLQQPGHMLQMEKWENGWLHIFTIYYDCQSVSWCKLVQVAPLRT